MAYSILWIDTGFAECKSENTVSPHKWGKQLRDELKIIKERGFEVCVVSDFDSFSKEIGRSGLYQAVFLEIQGLNPLDSKDFSLAYRIYKRVVETTNILLFVYSNNKDEERTMPFLKSLYDDGCCFDKNVGIGPLLDVVKEKLDAKLHYYVQHKDCLDLINKGWIDRDLKDKMDVILQQYAENDTKMLIDNHIRSIMESMMTTLYSIHIIPASIKTPNDRIKYISRDCLIRSSFGVKRNKPRIPGSQKKSPFERDYGKREVDYEKNKSIDSEKPKFPYELCSKAMKYTLKHLWDMAKIGSHSISEGKAGEEQVRNVSRATYLDFFAVVNWFHCLMSKYEEGGKALEKLYAELSSEKVVPIGPLVFDKFYNFCVCGKYIAYRKEVEDANISFERVRDGIDKVYIDIDEFKDNDAIIDPQYKYKWIITKMSKRD